MDRAAGRRQQRLSLLLTSPRVAPGLLSREAWRVLEDTDSILAADPLEGQAAALADQGLQVAQAAPRTPRALADTLLNAAASGTVAWVGGDDGDPGLTDALAEQLALRTDDPPEVEVLVGSWDRPGARLLDAVAVMDRLRSPGGCPWDAEQTHTSLTPYLIEEAHEAVEALEADDREHVVEELGDVLLQVLFHARVGAEHEAEPFDIDAVAARLVDKLVTRHPHVFADGPASTPGEVERSWEQLKAAEKPHREHPLDGIPAGLPDLARAAKIASRLERAGYAAWLREAVAGHQGVGAELMTVVLRARDAGEDPAAALRGLLRQLGGSVPDTAPPAG